MAVRLRRPAFPPPMAAAITKFEGAPTSLRNLARHRGPSRNRVQEPEVPPQLNRLEDHHLLLRRADFLHLIDVASNDQRSRHARAHLLCDRTVSMRVIPEQPCRVIRRQRYLIVILLAGSDIEEYIVRVARR